MKKSELRKIIDDAPINDVSDRYDDDRGTILSVDLSETDIRQIFEVQTDDESVAREQALEMLIDQDEALRRFPITDDESES